MVPIESPLVVYYLTSNVSNVVSHTAFEIFDIKDFSIGAMVRINSTSGLADRNISDFHQKQSVTRSPVISTLVASLVKIGRRLRSVERSIRFM